MENADTAVLSSLESNLLHPRALDLGLQRAIERITRPRVNKADTAAELRAVEHELARLTDAIAVGGGSVPALVAAVNNRESRRRELLAHRDEHRRVAPVNPQIVRADLEQRLGEWRSLIQDRAQHGRRLLKQLIVGRLGPRTWKSGTTTFWEPAPCYRSSLESHHRAWRPHTDSVPLARSEDARRKPEDRCGRRRLSASEGDGVPTGVCTSGCARHVHRGPTRCVIDETRCQGDTRRVPGPPVAEHRLNTEQRMESSFVTTQPEVLPAYPHACHSPPCSHHSGDIKGRHHACSQCCRMAVLLLVLFPILLMYNTPLAAVALVSAIVLLYRGKTSGATSRHPRSRPTNDAAI